MLEKIAETQCEVNAVLGVTHHFSKGIYAKQMHIPKGYVIGSHLHTYPHLSILAKGVAAVGVNGLETTYHAPACIEIAAGLEHRITAVSDVVWYCIHATDETDPEKVDEVLIKKAEDWE